MFPYFEKMNNFSVTSTSDTVTVINPKSEETTSNIYFTAETPNPSYLPLSVTDKNGVSTEICVCGQTKNILFLCFPATIPADTEKIFKLNYGTPKQDFSVFSETVKIIDTNLYQITQNDNGTYIITSKNSGNIFFETPTVIISGSSTTRPMSENRLFYNTFAYVGKTSSEAHGEFSSFLPFTVFDDNGDLDEFKLRASLFCGKNDSNIFYYLDLKALPHHLNVTLRIPTGLDYPEILTENGNVYQSGNELHEDGVFNVISNGENVLSVSPLFEYESASISADGNLDIKVNPKENRLLLKLSFQ